LGDTFIAAIRNRATGCGPGEQALLDLEALGLSLVFGKTDSGHFGVDI
jgi:hypothetical protein